VNAAVRRGVCREHPLCSNVDRKGRECEKRQIINSLYCDLHSKPVVISTTHKGKKCNGINAKGRDCKALPSVLANQLWYCSAHKPQESFKLEEETEESSEEELDIKEEKINILLPVVECRSEGWSKMKCNGWLNKAEQCDALIVVARCKEKTDWLCVLHEKREKKKTDKEVVFKEIIEKLGENMDVKVIDNQQKNCSGINSRGKECGTVACLSKNGKWFCLSHSNQFGEEKINDKVWEKSTLLTDQKRELTLKPSEEKILNGRIFN